ncbi:hypothetical protein ACFLU6_13550 [Acidobacteriota bacterium]
MKTKKNVLSRSLIVVCLLALLVSPLSADNGQGCDQVTVMGNTVGYLDSMYGLYFMGTAQVYFKGEENALTADVTVYLLGTPEVKKNGTQIAMTTHIFEFGVAMPDGMCEPGEDCFVTEDAAVLIPQKDDAGLFRLRAKTTVMAGEGHFQDASGNLRTRGEIQFIPPSDQIPDDGMPDAFATWMMRGKICD